MKFLSLAILDTLAASITSLPEVEAMAGGNPRVERTPEAFQDAVTRTVSRQRPVLPVGHGKEGDDGEDGQGEDGQGVGNPPLDAGVLSP